jgi:hypothetical protein
VPQRTLTEEEASNFLQLIERAAEDAGFADSLPSRYSGRGMHGKECLALHGNEESDLFKLGFYTALHADSFDVEVSAELFHAQTDTLGHNIVIYWPDLILPEVTE